MQLYFPFSLETRQMYMYTWSCMKCGKNGSNVGGLELHHICGRKKHDVNMDSPLNASVLCHQCHKNVSHSQEEQRYLFLINARHLRNEKYIPKYYDIIFLENNAEKYFGLTPREAISLI